MFNSDWRKEAVAELERSGRIYQNVFNSAIQDIENLHGERLESVELLKKVEDYFYAVRNKPHEFEKVISEIHVRRVNFEAEIIKLKHESSNADNLGNLAGAGGLAGAGIAALGPNVAMAIATTFGTASTGTAIGALAGAAQMNAALAWIGGGALATGGGGMAAGQAFLKLLGPTGWALSAIALVGGGIWANSKNKEIARKAEAKTVEIKNETEKVREVNAKVKNLLTRITSELNSGIQSCLDELKRNGKYDYSTMTNDDKSKLIVIKNSAESLSKLIGEKVQ